MKESRHANFGEREGEGEGERERERERERSETACKTKRIPLLGDT